MKKIICILFITIIYILSLSACNSGEAGFIEISKTNINQNESIDEQAEGTDSKTNNTSKKGLVFPQYSITAEHDGHTYELVNEENNSSSSSSNKYAKTLIYRYTENGDKQPWHVLDGRPGVMGIFDNGKLIYLQSDGNYDNTVRLKSLDLQTLVTEELMVKDRIKGMFQYDNYIMLMCGRELIRYDLLQKTKKSIIYASSMGSDCYLDEDNVFACNNKLWIIAEQENAPEFKVFSSDLDGNNLSYSGISLSNFYNIVSVNEKESTFTYNENTGKTDENRHYIFEKRTVSLSDKNETNINGDSKNEQSAPDSNPKVLNDYVEFDSSGVKVGN